MRLYKSGLLSSGGYALNEAENTTLTRNNLILVVNLVTTKTNCSPLSFRNF